jgi:hypothetical protein
MRWSDMPPLPAPSRALPDSARASSRLRLLVQSPGLVANAAAIVVGGLKCDGFAERILGKDGLHHSAIQWNMPILKAKRQQDFIKVGNSAKEYGLEMAVFCKEAHALSNSFDEYKKTVEENPDLTIVSIAIYGDDSAVRKAVKFLSVL